MRHNPRWDWLPLLVVMLLTGEWLRQPGPVWVVSLALAVLLLGWWQWPLKNWFSRVLLVTAIGLVVATAWSGWRLSAIDSRWESVREASLERASRRLGGYLRRAYDQVDHLTLAGLSASTGNDQAAAFRQLADAVPNHGPEYTVSVFGPSGLPWAWAGRNRLAPVPSGDSISIRWNKYYLLLEMRRHSAAGYTALATVVVAAAEVTPEPERSLAAIFRRESRVGLEVFPPGHAPDDDPDIYDYTEPTTAGPRVLFSVKPLPQDQGTAKEWVQARGRAAGTWLLLAVLISGLASVGSSASRFLLIPAFLIVLLRAPVGEALGLGPLFSPATFFRPLVGPFSTSIGMMAATATVVTILGVALWRRRWPRTWYGMMVGMVILLIAPDLYRELGRGITPPTEGVSSGLWITWQFMMVVAASGLFFITAAMFRGARTIEGQAWKIRLGGAVVLALAAAVVGTFLWDIGWPSWYVVLWIPPLLLVVTPAPRRATASAIALVAGSAAAMVTWGAVLEGAVNVARRDMMRLGNDPDPLAVATLEGFAERLAGDPEPSSAAELYVRWYASSLARLGNPGQLALWSNDGTELADLPLDAVSISPESVRRRVMAFSQDSSRTVDILPAVPGVHYLLLARTASGNVASAVVGPPTRLIARTQLGQALSAGAPSSPLYRIGMAPPVGPGAEVSMGQQRWRREGWAMVGEVDLAFPDGIRTVRAEVDLRGPGPVLVRGAIVVLLDVALVTLLWRLAEWLDGERWRIPSWRTMRRSFRLRLAGALALFFILPAVGFATWNFVRLTDEARRGRDLVTSHLLQDALAFSTRGGPVDWGSGYLQDLSRTVGSEFWLYGGGRLAGVSAPILRDLGVARPMLDPVAYSQIALGHQQLALTSEDVSGMERRVGHMVTLEGPPQGVVVLATPQLGHETGLESRLLDLAFVLLLATIAGLAGALLAARWVSGALTRPVADLRRAATAIGRGLPRPPATSPPLEFEPVFGAFDSMEQDIRSSKAALEAARQRTATVLATVATGVLAIDQHGRVLIANRRAEEFLGTEPREGNHLGDMLAPEWYALMSTVHPLLTQPGGDRTAEIEVRDRRYTVHCVSLGDEADGGGAVIALTDVTDLAQAERVLAWGEMARQVAHEIKNPLTPMRLGMQHLQRVQRDDPTSLPEVLDDTGERILGEIDRLDRIARAFSRFASPEEAEEPLVEVDLAAAAAEVLHLYELAGDGAAVELQAMDDAVGVARRDEVKEVLVNLVENARQAEARHVVVSVAPGRFSVADDGIGMAAHLAGRIFEPRFSTTSSGSGLGLAIVKRQVESWGGEVRVQSEPGKGTTVMVRLESEGSGYDGPNEARDWGP